MKFLNILLEGKKETLIDKYKDTETFVDAVELLEKLIDGDPSPTKKYSEWMIKQMIGLGNPLTYSIADNVNLFIELIEKFHKLSSSITPEDITYAETTSSLVNGNKILNGPKDINKYDSIWGLQSVLSAVYLRNVQKEKERGAKNESDRIYEDNRFLIVQPYTHGASCYYGRNTKWCTTSKGDTRYFDKYSDEGNLYYIIDKKSNDPIWGKMALLVRNDGKTEVYDQTDGIRSVDVLLDRFSPIQEEIRKLVKGSKHYETLKGILEGKIDHVRGRIQSPHLGKIKKSGDDNYDVNIKFDGIYDFLNLFEEDVDENDLSFIGTVIDPPYGSELDLYDSYNFDDDFSDGYVLNYFNNEQLSILKEIIEVYNPEISKLIKDENGKYIIEDGDDKKISKFMSDKLDDSFMDSLRDTYSMAMNEGMIIAAQEEFSSLLCDLLSDIGFESKDNSNCFYEYNIDLSDLIKLYESSEYLTDLNLSDMLKEVVSNNVSFPIDYPTDLVYGHFDDKSFRVMFDSDLDFILEKEWEKLNDADFFLDFDKNLEIIGQVKEKFGDFGKYRKIPTTDNINVKVDRVDPETNKVMFTLNRYNPETDSFETKKGKSKLSSLLSMMSNYQLFDPFE
jgi:hypothetical protein